MIRARASLALHGRAAAIVLLLGWTRAAAETGWEVRVPDKVEIVLGEPGTLPIAIAVDPDADAPRFAVPMKAAAAGEFPVKIRLRMWLCGARSCRPLDVRRQTTVVVTAEKPAVP